MSHFWNDVMVFCGKWSTFIVGISIGIIGKISYEIYMKRTLSILQWFAIVGLSIFVGYLMSVYCLSKGMDAQAQFLVPITTLLGEKIVVYLFENYKSIIAQAIKLITPKK